MSLRPSGRIQPPPYSHHLSRHLGPGLLVTFRDESSGLSTRTESLGLAAEDAAAEDAAAAAAAASVVATLAVAARSTGPGPSAALGLPL